MFFQVLEIIGGGGKTICLPPNIFIGGGGGGGRLPPPRIDASAHQIMRMDMLSCVHPFLLRSLDCSYQNARSEAQWESNVKFSDSEVDRLKPMYSFGKKWKLKMSLICFVCRVAGVLKALWIVLSEAINILRQLHKTNIFGMPPKNLPYSYVHSSL